MYSFDINLEKKNAILKHPRRCKIASLLRFVEVCVVLVLISKLTIHFPAAVKNSGGYLRDLTVTLVSPHVVFIVGNLIVITLFAKSREFSGRDYTGADLYEEFLESSEKSQYETGYREKQRRTGGTEHREKQRKQIHTNTREHRRSQSENLRRVSCNKACQGVFRQSETEKYRKLNDFSETMVKNPYPEDNISSEEFRNIVEAFIERQKQFRKDEECSVLDLE